MNDQNRRRRLVVGGVVAAAAAALVGGAALVAGPALADNASNLGAGQAYGGQRAPMDATGTPPQRSDEKVLTGSDAEKAKAAALKAVPGATVIRVETDADGATYEAHLRKSDGSLVTVKMDGDFTVTGTESGMGGGGPARHGSTGGTPSASPTR